VVELTVIGGVPDIADYVIGASIRSCGSAAKGSYCMELGQVLSLSTYHRRTFFALVIALLVILVAADVTVLHRGEALSEIGSEIIGHIVAGITAALLVTGFLVYFVPRNERNTDLVQLPATEITPAFDQLLRSANRWRFKGNFGRYLRGRVLPTLASRSDVDVNASIIDPRDEALCRRHAQYREEIRGIDQGKVYTPHDVAREVLVTILHCAWHVVNNRMSIDLYLTGVFDPLRVDSCDEGMIVTVEDRRKPALKIGPENFMYDHFATHLRYAFRQGKKIEISGFKRCKSFSDVSEEDIEQFMAGLKMADLCRAVGLPSIREEFVANRNPYTD
jgi:hypothetical protein